MGGLLSFFGGAGKGAADVADNYMRQQADEKKMALQQSLNLDSRRKELEMQKQYTLDMEDHALDPVTARKKVAAEMIAAQAKDDFETKSEIGKWNNPDYVGAQQTKADVATKAQREMNDADNAAELEKTKISTSASLSQNETKASQQKAEAIQKEIDRIKKDGQSPEEMAQIDQLESQRRMLLQGSDSGYMPSAKKASVDTSQYDPIIERYTAQSKVPAALVKSMIATESSFRPNAVSKTGVHVGLMQVGPEVQQDYKIEDPTDPNQNIRGGVAFISDLMKRYSNNPDYQRLALAAYNWGPTNVDNALAKASKTGKQADFDAISGSMPKETTNYVDEVLSRLGEQQQTVAAKSFEEPAQSNRRQPIYGREVKKDVLNILSKAEDKIMKARETNPDAYKGWSIQNANVATDMLVKQGIDPIDAALLATSDDFQIKNGVIVANGQEYNLGQNFLDTALKMSGKTKSSTVSAGNGNSVTAKRNPIKDIDELQKAQQMATEVN